MLVVGQAQCQQDVDVQQVGHADSVGSSSRCRATTSSVTIGASGGDPGALLHRLPVDYVKIDGALMQGLANDRPLQDKVKALVDIAREHHITTIAERVEDANTMAVLWQLGVEFIQGYFVNSPEQVTIG